MNLDERADAYVDGYAHGKRLRAYPSELDRNLRHFDGDPALRYHGYVAKRMVAYVLGYSDGFHDVPPMVTA